GFGSKHAGTNKVHGNPLGKEEAKATKAVYGWNYEEEFTVPEEVKAHFEQLQLGGEVKEEAWNKLVAAYKAEFPEQGKLLEQAVEGNAVIDASEVLAFDASQ